MNRARDEFLAGTGFSGDKDGGVGRRDARDLFAQLANRDAASRYFRRTFKAHHSVAKPGVFAHQPSVFHRARCRCEQDFRDEWLGDEIERTAAHALDRKLNGRERSQKNDGQARIGFARGGQDVQSFAVSHLLIGDDGVEGLLAERGIARR